jgi:hypothetical protein
MGRLIDEDILIDSIPDLSVFEQEDFGTPDMIRLIEDAPTVKAIPKADYENRLKADMVAMLTEIQLECEENTTRWYVGRLDGKTDDVVLMETINEIIQEKINALKGEKDDK